MGHCRLEAGGCVGASRRPVGARFGDHAQEQDRARDGGGIEKTLDVVSRIEGLAVVEGRKGHARRDDHSGPFVIDVGAPAVRVEGRGLGEVLHPSRDAGDAFDPSRRRSAQTRQTLITGLYGSYDH